MPLTDSAVRHAQPRDKPYKMADSEGLYIHIMPNGSKLWRMKYRFDGLEKKLSFGPYRLAIDHYIEVASRRNNFIVEVNGIQLRRASVANMTETYAENRDRLRVGLARNANPWLSEYKEFFRDGQLSIKSAIGKTLYFANRALSLSRGENVPFNYDDRTISALEVARASILATRDELKTEYARDAQAFQNFKLDIFSRLTKSQLDNFRKSGEATFLIPTNLPFFRDRPMAMIEGVSVDLAGMPKPLRARFYHHGGSLVVNRQGLKTSFTHEPIPTIFEIDEEGAVLSDGAIVTGTGSDYVGVSPFAIWSVRVDAPPKALQRLKSLKMVMRGRSFVV